MKSYLFGHEHGTRKPFRIPKSSFPTHWHLIGGTGKGKTTALHTLLHQLLLETTHEPCVLLIDRMGNLSFELLLWMASEFCPDYVRERLVYIEPAREHAVIPFNPLLYDTPGHGYYKVARTMEIILRGWESQDLGQMPRLARWLWNCFWAAAQLGLTVADCEHLLLPASPYHRPLLEAMPERLHYEWGDLLRGSSNQVLQTLDSTRNRLKPFFDAPALRYMFGSTENRFDVHRFMREGKIVLVNLWHGNRIPDQLADTIGGLILNEVLMTARSLPLGERYDTYLFLDEFQRFVGPDIQAAIPEVRQLGIKLLLSHQSLSQLVRGDIDLTSLIFQCQSRMVFGVQGEDADLLAHELASLTYDAKRIKDELHSRRQRLSGHRIMDLSSESWSSQEAQNWSKGIGKNWARNENTKDGNKTGEGESRANQENEGSGGSRGEGHTSGTHQQLVPTHEEFWELSSRTYYTFEEQKNEWAREIRRLKRGEAFVRLVDDTGLYHVDVKRSAPGHLAWDQVKLRRDFPSAIEDVHRLIDENFRSDLFLSPAFVETEMQSRLARVLRPAIMIEQLPAADGDGTAQKTQEEDNPLT
jgi:hypothetical protein